MANKIKIARYETTILEVINTALNYEVNNKIATNATVTRVELTNDLSVAKIYLDCLHRENIDKIVANVEKVSGFLRMKVANALNTYKAPELRFYPDKSIDYANNIDELLKQIKEKEGNK